MSKIVLLLIVGSFSRELGAQVAPQEGAHPGIRARQRQDALLSVTSPQSTVCPSGTPLQGIDVSRWQGTIDWPQVAGAGISFAYARVADGLSFPDATFQTNWANAKAAGLKVGAYYFFEPGQDPTAQANALLAALTTAGFTGGDLLPCVDFEVTGGQPPATILANLTTFVNAVTAGIGTAPVIYTSPSFWNAYGSPAFSADPLWIANWGVACPNLPSSPWTTWAIWQYSATGSVAGISGDVDLDESNGALPLYAPASVPGTCANPELISSFPYSNSSTTVGRNSFIDGYACPPSSGSEAGPEVVYQVTVSAPGNLAATVTDGPGVDIDPHLLSACNPSTCLARNDTTFSRAIPPGTYFIVCDTWTSSSGTQYPGAYTLDVSFTITPTAVVSGAATICAGGSTPIQADLTGTGPWSLTWSDGYVQSGVSSSLATRSVSPPSTTTYTLTAVSDSCCAGTSSGSAPVTVMPDTVAPTVTPPAGVTLSQSICCGTFGGVQASDAAVSAFLAGATATDDCATSLTQLPPQVGLVEVTPTTCFEVGDTTVTFRFQDAALNTGTATATATVRMFGDLNLDETIDSGDLVVLRAFINGVISAGTPPFHAPQALANVSHDGGEDAGDMIVLRAYVNGAIPCMAP